ncbi:unnamed protein product, partial [Didymodactylos carnosus]
HEVDDSYLEMLKSNQDQLSLFDASTINDLCLRVQQAEYSCQQMLNDKQKMNDYIHEQCPHIPVESKTDLFHTVEHVTQLYVQQSDDIKQTISDSIDQLKLFNITNLENTVTLRQLFHIWSKISKDLQEKNNLFNEQLQLNQDEKQTMFNAYYSLCNYIQHIKEKLINISDDTVHNEPTYDQFESTFQLNEIVNRLKYENQQSRVDNTNQIPTQQENQQQQLLATFPSGSSDFVLPSVQKVDLSDSSVQTDSINNDDRNTEVIDRLRQLNSQLENEYDLTLTHEINQHPLDRIEFLIRQLQSQLFSETSRCQQYVQANEQWQKYFEKNYAEEFQRKFSHLLSSFEQEPIEEYLTLDHFSNKLLNIIEHNETKNRQIVNQIFEDVIKFDNENENSLEQQLQTIKKELEYYKQQTMQSLSSVTAIEERQPSLVEERQSFPVEEHIQIAPLHTKENDEQTAKLEKALNLLKLQTTKLKSAQEEIEQLKGYQQQQQQQQSDPSLIDELTIVNEQILEMKSNAEQLHSKNLLLIEQKHQLELQLDQMVEQQSSMINMAKYNEILIEQLKFTLDEQQKIRENVSEIATMKEQIDIGLQTSVEINHYQTQTELITKESDDRMTQTDNTELHSNECQTDMIHNSDKEIQTQLVNQLWTLTYDENLDKSVDDEDEIDELFNTNQLNDELSSMSLDSICNYLSSESRQIITRSKLNFNELQILDDPNEVLFRLCYLAYRCYQNQLQSCEAKHLYNEGYIRVLKDEYQLLNSEKNDKVEQLSFIQEQNYELQKKLDKLKDERSELNFTHDSEIDELKLSHDKILDDMQLYQQQLLDQLNLKSELCEKLSTEIKEIKYDLHSRLSYYDQEHAQYEQQKLHIQQLNDLLNEYNYPEMKRKYMDLEQDYVQIKNDCNYFRQQFEQLKNVEIAVLEQKYLEIKQELDAVQREKETLEELNSELFQYKMQFQQQYDSDMQPKLSSTRVTATSAFEQEDNQFGHDVTDDNGLLLVQQKQRTSPMILNKDGIITDGTVPFQVGGGVSERQTSNIDNAVQYEFESQPATNHSEISYDESSVLAKPVMIDQSTLTEYDYSSQPSVDSNTDIITDSNMQSFITHVETVNSGVQCELLTELKPNDEFAIAESNKKVDQNIEESRESFMDEVQPGWMSHIYGSYPIEGDKIPMITTESKESQYDFEVEPSGIETTDQEIQCDFTSDEPHVPLEMNDQIDRITSEIDLSALNIDEGEWSNNVPLLSLSIDPNDYLYEEQQSSHGNMQESVEKSMSVDIHSFSIDKNETDNEIDQSESLSKLITDSKEIQYNLTTTEEKEKFDKPLLVDQAVMTEGPYETHQAVNTNTDFVHSYTSTTPIETVDSDIQCGLLIEPEYNPLPIESRGSQYDIIEEQQQPPRHLETSDRDIQCDLLVDSSDILIPQSLINDHMKQDYSQMSSSLYVDESLRATAETERKSWPEIRSLSETILMDPSSQTEVDISTITDSNMQIQNDDTADSSVPKNLTSQPSSLFTENVLPMIVDEETVPSSIQSRTTEFSQSPQLSIPLHVVQSTIMTDSQSSQNSLVSFDDKETQYEIPLEDDNEPAHTLRQRLKKSTALLRTSLSKIKTLEMDNRQLQSEIENLRNQLAEYEQPQQSSITTQKPTLSEIEKEQEILIEDDGGDSSENIRIINSEHKTTQTEVVEQEQSQETTQKLLKAKKLLTTIKHRLEEIMTLAQYVKTNKEYSLIEMIGIIHDHFEQQQFSSNLSTQIVQGETVEADQQTVVTDISTLTDTEYNNNGLKTDSSLEKNVNTIDSSIQCELLTNNISLVESRLSYVNDQDIQCELLSDNVQPEQERKVNFEIVDNQVQCELEPIIVREDRATQHDQDEKIDREMMTDDQQSMVEKVDSNVQCYFEIVHESKETQYDIEEDNDENKKSLLLDQANMTEPRQPDYSVGTSTDTVSNTDRDTSTIQVHLVDNDVQCDLLTEQDTYSYIIQHTPAILTESKESQYDLVEEEVGGSQIETIDQNTQYEIQDLSSLPTNEYREQEQVQNLSSPIDLNSFYINEGDWGNDPIITTNSEEIIYEKDENLKQPLMIEEATMTDFISDSISGHSIDTNTDFINNTNVETFTLAVETVDSNIQCQLLTDPETNDQNTQYEVETIDTKAVQCELIVDEVKPFRIDGTSMTDPQQEQPEVEIRSYHSIDTNTDSITTRNARTSTIRVKRINNSVQCQLLVEHINPETMDQVTMSESPDVQDQSSQHSYTTSSESKETQYDIIDNSKQLETVDQDIQCNLFVDHSTSSPFRNDQQLQQTSSPLDLSSFNINEGEEKSLLDIQLLSKNILIDTSCQTEMFLDLMVDTTTQTENNEEMRKDDTKTTPITDNSVGTSVANRLFGFFSTSQPKTATSIEKEEPLLKSVPLSGSSSISTVSSFTQTDNEPQEKLKTINAKLKRALQSIKEKIHKIVEQRPDLFNDYDHQTTDFDTMNYLDFLMKYLLEKKDHESDTIRMYEIQIENLFQERNMLNEQHLEEIRQIDDQYKSDLKQLNQQLNEKENELSMIKEEEIRTTEHTNDLE